MTLNVTVQLAGLGKDIAQDKVLKLKVMLSNICSFKAGTLQYMQLSC